MAYLDWVVLVVASLGIGYCLLTMPKPIITRREWEKLPDKRTIAGKGTAPDKDTYTTFGEKRTRP